MDIGRILRERSKIRTYKSEPKKPPRRWGVYPSLIVDQLIFFEDDDFRCQVSLFSNDEDEILGMQKAAIAEAAIGMNKGGWKFYLHAANHDVKKVAGGLYRSRINLVFKVEFPENLRNKEVK